MTEKTIDRAKRPKRIPLGTRNVLTAPKKAGYIRRFVNDDGDRVKDFEAAGYSVVRDDISVGDHKAGKDTKVGSIVSPSVGAGSRAVLMEIKEEWYEEDQKDKQNRIAAVEKDMKRSQNVSGDGMFGEVRIT